MAGQIKHIIDTIMAKRTLGNPMLISTTRTKLLLKGINTIKFTDESPDDPVVIAQLDEIAREFGIILNHEKQL